MVMTTALGPTYMMQPVNDAVTTAAPSLRHYTNSCVISTSGSYLFGRALEITSCISEINDAFRPTK